MQIFVRTLDDRTLTFDVESNDTINDIKERVEQREGNYDLMIKVFLTFYLFKKVFPSMNNV